MLRAGTAGSEGRSWRAQTWTASAGHGAVEPAVEAVGLAFAHERSEVLGQGDRQCQSMVLRCKVRQELRVSICLFPRLLQHHTPHGLLVHGLTPFLPAPVYHLERLILPVHLDTQKQMDSKAQLTLSPGAVWRVGTMATCVIRTCAIFSTRIVP